MSDWPAYPTHLFTRFGDLHPYDVIMGFAVTFTGLQQPQVQKRRYHTATLSSKLQGDANRPEYMGTLGAANAALMAFANALNSQVLRQAWPAVTLVHRHRWGWSQATLPK